MGVYDNTDDIRENHNVYKHETRKRYLVFNAKDGWTVYWNPDDPDNPASVSFIGCKLDDPTECHNNGGYRYFHNGGYKNDTNMALSLHCLDEKPTPQPHTNDTRATPNWVCGPDPNQCWTRMIHGIGIVATISVVVTAFVTALILKIIWRRQKNQIVKRVNDFVWESTYEYEPISEV